MARGQARGAPRERAAAIRERLGEVLDERPGELRRLSGGASRETYLLASPSHGELVLQLERGGKPSGEPPGQAALLEAAAHAGVPVARVIAHGEDDEALGRSWTLVQALTGTTDPTEIVAADAADSRAELIDSVARALCAVHAMPAEEALAPAVDRPLAQLRGLHDGLGEPHPVFELAFRTLGEDRAPSRRTLVHGDFRMGNLMVDGERVTGVLDWELAHIGDPVEDLGWLCVPAWRFARPDLPAAGIGTREQLLDAYARHAGVEVQPDALRRWELAGTLRWGVICVMQASAHLSGAIRSVEHAVIGRRACEVEWDLLQMLDAGGGGPAQARGSDGSQGAQAPAGAEARAGGEARAHGEARAEVHDRPSTAELLEAARGALGDDVLPLLEGRAAFQARVTLRALGMVRRELEHAGAHAALRARVLAQLGAEDERELSAAIREGAFDGRERELCAALRELVRAKLEVANPRYLHTYEDKEEP